MQELKSGEDYYSAGILTGLAVAVELAEESANLTDLIYKLRKRIYASKPQDKN